MTLASDRVGSHPLGERVALLLAILVTVPGLVVRLTGAEFAHPVEALLCGLAIVGAAFVLLLLWTTAGRALSATCTAPPPMIAPASVSVG